MFKYPQIRFAFLLIFLFGIVLVSYSQPSDPEGNPDPVPITGIEILIGLGGLFGVKKVLDSKNKRS